MANKIDENDPNSYVISKLNGKKYSRITHKHLKRYDLTIEQYCEKYNLTNIDLIAKNLKDRFSFTKEQCLEKYGVEAGTKKWEEYCRKQSITNTFEYKNKKYGMTEEEFKEYNNSRAVTKENLINRHGEEKGLAKWNAYCERQAVAGCSLEYFIDKYGEEEGKQEYERVNRLKTHSLEAYIERYGEEEGAARYREVAKSKLIGSSPLSQSLFKELSSNTNNRVYYAESDTSNREFVVLDIPNRKSYFYDYVDVDNKKCVEFNGDIFHGNPLIYKEDDRPNPFSDLSCKEMWEYDELKKNVLKEIEGIDTLIIWESEYRNDKEGAIKKCLEFLGYES